MTGITTLGIDHVAVLWDTIDKIAWHRLGDFNTGRPAFTVEQVPDAAEMLERRVAEQAVKSETVKVQPVMSRFMIVPDADHQ